MQKLFESLFEHFETEAVAKEEFLRQKFASIAALDMTAGELFEAAASEGWDRWLRNLTLVEFGHLATGPELIIEEFEAREASESGQPIKVVRRPEDLNECIIGFLRTRPWIEAETISEGIDLSLEVIKRKLGELLESEVVKTVEDGATTRYALN